MLRKTTFALATVAALGAAALAPTSASAHGFGGHGHGFGRGWGWGGLIVGDPCLQPVLINTPVGPVTRLVNVCY